MDIARNPKLLEKYMKTILKLAPVVSKNSQLPPPFVYICLALAVIVNCYTAFQHFSSTALDFDAATYYLPYAQQLLNDGLRFFADEKSLRYPPMAYVYPALFGAEQLAIKIANIALSCFLVVLLYRIGQLLHSRQAGLFAAFLFALSPPFRHLIPRVLTEPLLLFLVGVWFWCMAEIIINQKYRLAVLGGIAFGLAILTRGSFYYFLYVTIITAGALILFTDGERRRMWQSILSMHLIALSFPLIFLVKNWLLFGYPFFATGAGTALYFGSHPLVNGYELPYYGLGYDDGAVTMEHDHLSVIGDRLLKGVALTMLGERSWADLLATYTQKTGAFIFVSKAILPDTLWNIRSLRIIEVILGVIGLLSIRQRLMQILIGGILAYQIAVHIPLLYTHRYSVGAIDLWLVLLAGIGLATILKHRSLNKVFAASLIIFIAVVIGELHRKYSKPLSPEITKVPHQVIWQQSGRNLAPIGNIGFMLSGPGEYRLSGDTNALDIPVRGVHQLNQAGNYVLSLRLAVLAETESHCKKFRVLYRRLVDTAFTDSQSVRLRIENNGEMYSYNIGATLPLALISDGDIRLGFECPSNTKVMIDSMSISVPQVAETYRQLYLNPPNNASRQ
jgi:4-amino-4-deoxy-L-arabinose transferase-like glycosyltransferase